MLDKRFARQIGPWGIPAFYAAAALVVGLTLPRIESRIFPGLIATVSVATATTIYSTIASGMIALTGIVFSLTFVMVQFSATTYSPRLVLWLARDPVMSHALGIFTATFLYAVAALAGIDRRGSGTVPFISAWVVVGLLVASVALFIALIHRIGMLQVTHMLAFTGDQGRKAIAMLSRSVQPAVAGAELQDMRALPRIQTLTHRGSPRSIQAVDAARLVRLAEASGGVIELVVAVGDGVKASTPLLHVLGARRPIAERALLRGIVMGEERTFEQDPKYAIRLLVDIAIRALSPAINDPTTAVQALSQIEDLLLRLGEHRLDIGTFRDQNGRVRLTVPCPAWEDFLRLAFDEICTYGAGSVQVTRRLNAVISDLIHDLPEERRPALRHWEERLRATIVRSFADVEERAVASQEDRQGLGVPRQRLSESA